MKSYSEKFVVVIRASGFSFFLSENDKWTLEESSAKRFSSSSSAMKASFESKVTDDIISVFPKKIVLPKVAKIF